MHLSTHRKRALAYVLAVAAVSLCPLPASGAIPPAERDALIALFGSTGGASWIDHSGWDGPPGSECTWYGVTCDASGTEVASIVLSGNGLAGSLPDLSVLTQLRALGASGNQLSGTIPELSNLTALTALNLWDNQLSGPIPDLSALTQLVYLNLSVNQLTGPIPELDHLTELADLRLTDNQLSGPIPNISNLTRLTRLQLHGNQLSGPIPDITNLTQLQILDLWNNQLTGPIPDLDHLAHLTGLLLAENQLSGPIPDLSQLTELSYVDLGSNHLTGPIPDLGNLTRLTHLFLHNNHLTGEIPDLSYQTQLLVLVLSHNQLSGPFPEVGHLTELTRLHLRGNRLLGEIPPELWQLTQLADGDGLDLRWNGLFTADPDLLAFLNGKQIGGDLQRSQTVPPEDVRAENPTLSSIDLRWTPIAYSGASGRYRVRWGASAGGPYPFAVETADKSSNGLTVERLEPGTTYHFVVETETDPHYYNQSTVVSLPSPEVSASTLSPAELFVCDGFGPPMNVLPVAVRGHRVLPLKARLFDSGGSPVSDADLVSWPVIRVQFDPGSGNPPVDVSDLVVAAGMGSDDGRFVFVGNRWRFNLKTDNYSGPGLYLIDIETGDATEYTIYPTCEAGFEVE